MLTRAKRWFIRWYLIRIKIAWPVTQSYCTMETFLLCPYKLQIYVGSLHQGKILYYKKDLFLFVSTFHLYFIVSYVSCWEHTGKAVAFEERALCVFSDNTAAAWLCCKHVLVYYTCLYCSTHLLYLCIHCLYSLEYTYSNHIWWRINWWWWGCNGQQMWPLRLHLQANAAWWRFQMANAAWWISPS